MVRGCGHVMTSPTLVQTFSCGGSSSTSREPYELGLSCQRGYGQCPHLPLLFQEVTLSFPLRYRAHTFSLRVGMALITYPERQRTLRERVVRSPYAAPFDRSVHDLRSTDTCPGRDLGELSPLGCGRANQCGSAMPGVDRGLGVGGGGADPVQTRGRHVVVVGAEPVCCASVNWGSWTSSGPLQL